MVEVVVEVTVVGDSEVTVVDFVVVAVVVTVVVTLGLMVNCSQLYPLDGARG